MHILVFPEALSLLSTCSSTRQNWWKYNKCQLTTVNYYLILHPKNIFIINRNSCYAHWEMKTHAEKNTKPF